MNERTGEYTMHENKHIIYLSGEQQNNTPPVKPA